MEVIGKIRKGAWLAVMVALALTLSLAGVALAEGDVFDPVVDDGAAPTVGDDGNIPADDGLEPGDEPADEPADDGAAEATDDEVEPLVIEGAWFVLEVYPGKIVVTMNAADGEDGQSFFDVPVLRTKNHGGYVSALAQALEPGEGRGEIISALARSDAGKKPKEDGFRGRSGTPEKNRAGADAQSDDVDEAEDEAVEEFEADDMDDDEDEADDEDEGKGKGKGKEKGKHGKRGR